MIGNQNGTSVEQLEDSITQQTVGIHYYASGDPDDSILDLDGILSVAGRHNLPVTIDAAYQVYPLDTMKAYAQTPDALIGFGAKYIGACNSTGILCGKKELVEAAYAHSFIGFETGDLETVGRPLKLDRQEVVAVVVALQEWLAMDHEKERIEPAWKRTRYIERRIKKLPGLKGAEISFTPESGEGIGYHTIGLYLKFKEKTEDEVREMVWSLREDDPEIWLRSRGIGTSFGINCLTLLPGQEKVLVERFTKLFS